MNLQDYINEAEKTYRFRLKSIVKLDDEAMDKVEMSVARFQPTEISRPTKTILQKQPLDFQGVENAEVYIVDMTFSLPVVAHVLRNDIRKVLKAPEEYIVVHETNEPIEIESLTLDALAEIEAEALKKGLKPAALLSSPDYPEVNEIPGSEMFGDEYNAGFLSYLQDVQKSREERRVDPLNPLFKFLDLPNREDQEPVQSSDDFNAHIPDAPKVHPVKKAKPFQSIQGNIDDTKKIVKRIFTDKNGDRVVISREIGGTKS